MRVSHVFSTIDSHTGGEPTRTIIGGLPYLPGVFSVGGLNTLVKKKILPGERFLLAGAGPLRMSCR